MGLDASHLVHMPSHIYYWVGRYQDAANANIAAVTICHAEMARFEDPNAVLALSEPKLPYLAAAWHYARGEAYTYLGDSAAALIEAGEIPVSINPVGDGDELSAP